MTERESHFLDLLCGSHEFFTVKAWMEKNMPKEREEYCKSILNRFPVSSNAVDYWRNLSNLVAYLIEHREEWGVIGNDEDGFIFHPALVWWDKEE